MNNKSLTKFFTASALFFIWVTAQGALQAQEPVHEFIEQGPAGIIVGAHVHIGTLGWISMALMGMMYYLVPLLSEKPLSWPRMVNWIFWVEVVTIVLNGILMIGAGISGGRAFQAGLTGDALNAAIGPYMMLIALVSLVCGLAAIAFAVQIIHTATKKSES
ncbi:MAG: cbb3-type cytochrome c oxidase subunit I [Anaerolineae bacterium]